MIQLKPNKTPYFDFKNLFISLFFSFLVLGVFWCFSSGLHKLGCPFPSIAIDKFFDLGFFALSNFSFITFLAMIPFQATEGQLSPGFFAKIINRPWSHFGLYLLLSSFTSCFLIIGFENEIAPSLYGQLFMTIVGAVIFAIIFHLGHTLRYLYQPLVVYENLTQLADEERSEELWFDLYECTFKAIKANRLGNARSFIDLMSNLYVKMDEKKKTANLKNDVRSLYQVAKEISPITTHIEKHWPYLKMELNSTQQAPKEPIDAINKLEMRF